MDELRQLAKQEGRGQHDAGIAPVTLALDGLRRIAFGSANDAARLVCCEEELSGREIAAMDLFCVAEMKKPKGGGLEVRFFDRLKAMELLLRAGGEQDRSQVQDSLRQALDKGAAAMGTAHEGSHGD